MDHILPCSEHLRFPPVEVEYVCDATNFLYDYHGFRGYPARAGVDIALLEVDQLPMMKLEDSAPFIQAWLWFGLLAEALGVDPLETADPLSRIFLRTAGSRKYLCTRRLGEMIQAVKASENTHCHDSKIKRLSSYIQTVLNFSQRALSSSWSESRMKRADISHPVFQSILASQVLCRTLLEAFCISTSTPNELLKSAPPSPFSTLGITDTMLLQAGWCPKEIRRLPPDVCLRYYLGLCLQYPTAEAPTHTGSEDCTCVSNSDEVVTPSHTHSSYGCATLEVSSALIRHLISEGKVVLVRFCPSADTSTTLQVKGIDIYDENTMPFIAVSHVRMAGLGNETGNSLPSCQVTLIQSLADQLLVSKTGNAFFWIDTLCVPGERNLRKKALRSAWQIFAKAQHTLVLDPPLYQHRICTSEDALIRIRYSGWKMRLWTLKEGFLARDLIFQFHDRLVSLQELLNNFGRHLALVGKGLTVLQERDTPIRQDMGDKTPELIKRFEDDIIYWSANEPDIPIIGSPEHDKMILYRALRLAFLSAQKFQYFLEDDEFGQIPILWEVLTQVYEEEAFQEAGLRMGRLRRVAMKCHELK
ncbi:hypothetical protein GGR52DRAFT_563783 [Hypoxylon sp. FL1284]|nr:hypothetical protein GGR52DRAFT_563783 [Hypoxylon sp. FL1284]